VLEALGRIDGLRPAAPGEFTRRALENGRIDLAEAEGLGDLLMAETQSQRRAALSLAGGALGRQVDAWRRELLQLAAQVEAALDFADEDDVGEGLGPDWLERLLGLRAGIDRMLAQPPAERLKDGVRVVIAGPPNAGKSTLLNRLAGREAAITSATPGTTRDIVEAPTAIGGIPFLFTDTAGLRESDDPVEAVGVTRAQDRIAGADIILWLGDSASAPDALRTIRIEAKADEKPPTGAGDVAVSALTGAGIAELLDLLSKRVAALLPQDGEVVINNRHRHALAECSLLLAEAVDSPDLLVAAEALRQTRASLDRITGRAGVDDMLDALFAGFCIGK
jgi:tRNA modification GTPase